MNIKTKSKQKKENLILKSESFPNKYRKKHENIIKKSIHKLLNGWIEMMKDGVPT